MTALIPLHKHVSPNAHDLALYLAAAGSLVYCGHEDKVQVSATGRKMRGAVVRELVNLGVARLEPDGLILPTERLSVQILFEPKEK